MQFMAKKKAILGTIVKPAGTELGKAQPKLGLGKIVAKLHNFGL